MMQLDQVMQVYDYSAQAWSASANNTSQWVTMDMGESKSIKGVQIQGRTIILNGLKHLK